MRFSLSSTQTVLIGALSVFLLNGSSALAQQNQNTGTPVTLKKDREHNSNHVGHLLPPAPAPIDATIVGESELIFFFHYDMGEAEITISADNSVWSVSETVDTADGLITISVSPMPDDYTITIHTDAATYVGYYTICDGD